MTEHPFNNDSTPAERREVLENDRRNATYHGRAINEANLSRGRYGAIDKTAVVDGAMQYPAGPNWSATQLPDEPPLGVSVNDQEAVGTFSEVQRSLGKLGATELLPGAPDGGGARSGSDHDPAVVEQRPPTNTDDDEPPQAA